MVEDRLATFSTWSQGIGIFALGEESLDYRLQHAPEVDWVVTGLLESLKCRLRTCRLPSRSYTRSLMVFDLNIWNTQAEKYRLEYSH